MKTRTVSFLAATALAATATAVAIPAGAGAARAPYDTCGVTTTKNGGKAGNIRASKVSCKTARAVARRANGHKTYSASHFLCHGVNSIYLCGKKGSTATIVFAYRKPKH